MGAARKEAIANLLAYRAEKVELLDLIKERHKSKRLGNHFNAAGMIKPAAEVEAHAIVSGKKKLTLDPLIL